LIYVSLGGSDKLGGGRRRILQINLVRAESSMPLSVTLKTHLASFKEVYRSGNIAIYKWKSWYGVEANRFGGRWMSVCASRPVGLACRAY